MTDDRGIRLEPGQLDSLRHQLEAQRDAIVAEIDELGAAVNARADCTVTDQADAAALQENRHRAAALREQRRELLVEIDAALRRIETGRYGISTATGEPIPYARLEVVPWARD